MVAETAPDSTSRCRAAFLGALLLAALPPACGGSSDPAPPAESVAEPATSQATNPGRGASVPAAELLGAEPYDSAELGALHGEIRFVGAVPERFQLGAAQMKECQHHPEVDQRSNKEIVNAGKLANAFVRLKSGYDKARIPPAPSTPVTLDQKGCMYVPRVLGLQLGQKLLVANSDPTNHNVHARSRKNDELNRNMGAGQPPVEFSFEHGEGPIPFQCDIHSWMGAAVFVEEQPWFAVTDEAGAFHIRDVPPGEYVVEAVHESLGRAQGTVSVAAGKSTGFTLTIRK